MQDTLSKRISAGKALSEDEISALVSIIGARCKDSTKRRLMFALRCVPDIRNYGIYGRVHLQTPTLIADYCAGQSYPEEIRELRRLILG